MPTAKPPNPPPNNDDKYPGLLSIPPTNFYGRDATARPHAGFHPGVLSHMAKDDHQAIPGPVTMDNRSLAEAPSIHRRDSNLADHSLLDGHKPHDNTKVSPRLLHNGSSDNNNMQPTRPRFQREAADLRSSTSSPFRLQMPFITPGQLAFSALQFLPVPVLVLNSLKTVVIANEAMGQLLGLPADTSNDDDTATVLDQLKGQSLSQVGIDMLQHGRPVWLAWDTFLDSVHDDQASCGSQASDGEQQHEEAQHVHRKGDTTPTAECTNKKKKRQDQRQQTVVEVVISRKELTKPQAQLRPPKRKSEHQTFAKMIISVWEIAEHQSYFTLTFTNANSSSHVAKNKRAVARPSTLESAEKKSIATSSNPPSVTSSHDSSSSPLHRVSPGDVSLASSPFPPMGPPFKSMQSAPSVLQKMLIIKDALLDNTEQPIIAMWRDGSAIYPNAAARALMMKHPSAEAKPEQSDDNMEVLGQWTLYADDFSRILQPHEYPISVLVRTQTPFSGTRFGIIHANGKRLVYDVLAEAIRDEETGEFLAGVVTCRDVTNLAKEIDRIKEVDAERFKLICDSMPQLVWTTDPQGSLDFFNTRWTEFTGMTMEESLGIYNWTRCFHPEDMPETRRRWEHSLATGEPYSVEYRGQNKEGEWRWLLGRALPLRNPETGKIDKWFGTCTDVHESIETKLAARRTRQQLLSVISHAHVTIFTVDMNRKVTMLEVSVANLFGSGCPEHVLTLGQGALMEDKHAAIHGASGSSKWCIGADVDEVFNHLTPELPQGERPDFLDAIDAIIARKTGDYVVEHSMSTSDPALGDSLSGLTQPLL